MAPDDGPPLRGALGPEIEVQNLKASSEGPLHGMCAAAWPGDSACGRPLLWGRPAAGGHGLHVVAQVFVHSVHMGHCHWQCLVPPVPVQVALLSDRVTSLDSGLGVVVPASREAYSTGR